MRAFLRRLVEGNLQITPSFTVPKTGDFAKPGNDLSKCRLRGRPRPSRRAISIEFKSYANVMDNKKVIMSMISARPGVRSDETRMVEFCNHLKFFFFFFNVPSSLFKLTKYP